MIYGESVMKILAELRAKIKFKHEPVELKRLQEYVEACEELNSEQQALQQSSHIKKGGKINSVNNGSAAGNSIENTPDCCTLESQAVVNFHNQVHSFLNLIIAKYKKTGIPGLTAEHSLLITGTVYAILGKCRSDGLLSLQRDYQKAREYLTKSAACRNPMGTFELARCYDLAIGGECDPEHACQLYRASYKLGYIRGLHKYAIMLIRGNPYVRRNIMDGYYILKQAVTINDKIYIRSYYDLGMLYKSGVCDIFNDHRYAVEIFKAGALKGCKYCQFKLGEECEEGKTIEKNIEKAFYWYKMSSLNNLVEAQSKVAKILFGIKPQGTNSEEIEGKVAMMLNEIKAKKDQEIEGKVVLLEMNSKEKFYRYTDLELGVLKNSGKNSFEKFYAPGFNRLKEAFEMAYKAAVSGNIDSILLVAESLEKGFGTEKNLPESLRWYKIADSSGCENVREKINTLESKLERAQH